MPVKDNTSRDYRERINRVIFHVERHLEEELRLLDLAKIACFSPYHFHRLFTAFTGEPLGDFVRRLLGPAAGRGVALQTVREKVGVPGARRAR